MSLSSGNAPTTPQGTPSVLGYAPGVGPVPIQVDGPTGDSAQGAGNQQYAPAAVRLFGTSGNKGDVDAQNNAYITSGGKNTAAIAAGTAGNTVVKASAGRLCRVLVTTAGTAAAVIYDNATTASGTIIGVIAANAVAGTVTDFQMPATNGITVQGNASLPAITVSYS